MVAPSSAATHQPSRNLPSLAPGACPCCGSPGMRTFHEVKSVPTNSCILLKTREEALSYPRGDIRLGFCATCGFISNVAFDPKLTEYSGRYEETQAYSPTFNKFHEQLARSLVERHNLHERDIIEIGCGKGEFLRLLCEFGPNRGLGFDPGYSEARGQAQGANRFTVIRDFFSDDYADKSADFVCCKMTLEHIPVPSIFVAAAVKTVRKPNGSIFIQVPESMRIVRDCAFEDIYYEHCSYFSAGSLARLFRRLGLQVLSYDIAYDGQYLTVEAAYPGSVQLGAEPPLDDLAELARYVSDFPARVAQTLKEWEERLGQWQQQGKKVVIWGSGSKGVSFLTGVPGASAVSYAVDINPYRAGYYMPATGQEIVGPQQLKELRPDAVVVMNRVYVPEIRQMLGELGLNPELHAL